MCGSPDEGFGLGVQGLGLMFGGTGYRVEGCGLRLGSWGRVGTVPARAGLVVRVS